MERSEFIEHLSKQLLDKKSISVRVIGHGVSGKSRWARGIADCLGSQANLLETDSDIASADHRQLVVPKDFPGQKVRASIPIVHELKSLERDILALQKGVSILTINEPWSPSTVLDGRKPILLVEGMSASFLPDDLFDLTIACFTDDKTELSRRLARDTKERHRDATFIEKTHQIRRQ